MIRAFTKGPFTGKHITVILVLFFAVVIAVNVLMARLASSTFGGLVVENSYVASQKFNGWLDEARKEGALGWQVEASRATDGRVAVRLTGSPPQGVELSGDAWHPLGRMPDQLLRFARQKDGSFLSDRALPAGRWRLRLEAIDGKAKWRTERDIS